MKQPNDYSFQLWMIVIMLSGILINVGIMQYGVGDIARAINAQCEEPE